MTSVCGVASGKIPPCAGLKDVAFDLDFARFAFPLDGPVLQHGAGTGGIDIAIAWRKAE